MFLIVEAGLSIGVHGHTVLIIAYELNALGRFKVLSLGEYTIGILALLLGLLGNHDPILDLLLLRLLTAIIVLIILIFLVLVEIVSGIDII